MFKARRLLVPIDFSPESFLALDWAVKVAKDEHGASIELLHVMPTFVAMGTPESMTIDYASIYEEEKKAIKAKLKKLQHRIPQGIASTVTVSQGNIADAVEQLCGKESIDLVVMTTHGRKGLSHFLHGSTTEETARVAPCPVLVLHLNTITRETAEATCETVGEGWRE